MRRYCLIHYQVVFFLCVFFVRFDSTFNVICTLCLPALVRQCRQELLRAAGATTTTSESNNEAMMRKNLTLHALQVASTVAMGAASGRDALRLLVLSKRIQGDVEQFVRGELHNAGDNVKSFNLAVRKFQFFPLGKLINFINSTSYVLTFNFAHKRFRIARVCL